MVEENETESRSLLGEVGQGLKNEAKSWLLWAGIGAVIGALTLGGLGLYLMGALGLFGGAAAGAILGGLGAWLFYMNATTL